MDMTNEHLALEVQAGGDCALLWEAVHKLVYVLVYRHYVQKKARCDRAGVTLEDLQQEGFLAMLQAARAYDPARGYSFNAYLRYHVQNRVNGALGLRTARQAREPIHNAQSLDTPLQGAEDMSVEDTVADDAASVDMQRAEERIDNELLHDALDRALACLPCDQADIIRARYYDGWSVNEVAADRKRSTDDVQAAVNKGMRALRHGRAKRHIRAWLDEMDEQRYSYGVRGTGYRIFKRTHTSATEWAALKMIDGGGKADRSAIPATIKRRAQG